MDEENKNLVLWLVENRIITSKNTFGIEQEVLDEMCRLNLIKNIQNDMLNGEQCGNRYFLF